MSESASPDRSPPNPSNPAAAPAPPPPANAEAAYQPYVPPPSTAPMAVMEVPQGMFPEDKAPIWKAFREAADTDLPTAKFDMMDHDAFMERARKAFAVVQTGETALYGNIIIRKGVVRA